MEETLMIKVPNQKSLSDVLDAQVGESKHLCHHRHHWSRRDFIKSGAALMGVVAGLSKVNGAALARHGHGGAGIPTQLPDFSPVLASLGLGELPFYLPVEVDPFLGVFDPVQVPSTMWDFKGLVALVEAEGVSDATHNADGVERTWAVDFRYMDGMFIDRNGRRRHGTFGFF